MPAARASSGGCARLVDPSPPARVVDQVLVARPEVDEVAARVSAALPKPRRAQVVVRDGLEVIPARPGDGVDARRLGASLAKASLTGARTLSPALTHVEPELTTSAAEAAVDEATLVDRRARHARRSRARTSARSTPPRLAKLLRFRPAARASASRSIRSVSPRRSSRCSRRGAPARSTPASSSTASRCACGPRVRGSLSTAAGPPTRSPPPRPRLCTGRPCA